MSPKTSPTVPSIQEIHNLSTGARLAVQNLFSFRNRHTGLCNPKLAKLAERMAMPPAQTLRTLKRWMAEAKAAGAIHVTKHQRGASYEFSAAALAFCGANPKSCGAKSGTARGANRGTAGTPYPYTNLELNRESGGDDSDCIVSPDSPPPLPTPRPTPTPTQGEFAFEAAPEVNSPLELGSPCELPMVERTAPRMERKPPVQAQAPQRDAERFQRVQGSLRDLADALHRAPPDDGFVRLILAAAPQATGDEIHSTLVGLWKRDAFSTMRGWGLVLVKFKDCFGAAA